MRKAISAVGILIVTVLAVGCTAGSQTVQKDASRKEVGGMHLSRVTDYRDLASLKADSVAVVRATAKGASRTTNKGLPETVTEVSIKEVLYGRISGKMVSVSQLGSSEMQVSNASEILNRGSDYLLFLQASQEPGKYVITGGRGAYITEGQTGKYRFKGGDESELPLTISATELR